MGSDNRKKLSQDEAKRIMELPTLALPYVFDNGTVLEELAVFCCGCNKALEGSDLRGDFVAHSKMAVSLDGYGVCDDCKLFSPISVRARDDGSMLVKTDQGWRESRFAELKTPSVASRIWQLIFGA